VNQPNVILTTIHRLPAAAVAPFFLSLRRFDFSGEIVVFASGVDPESVLQLEHWGAQVKHFRFRGQHVGNRLARLWPIWRLAFASAMPEAAKHALAHQVFHLFYRRHLLYLEFLEQSGEKYERFLVTDCRDVFFQKDPFAWPQAEGLHAFLEEESSRVGRCPHHIRWIGSQFGEEVLRSLWNETVSCAGTVFGDRASLRSYLRKMIHLTMRARSLREADSDQGLHNVLVRREQPPNLTLHENRRGPVMTVGPMKIDDLRFNPDGWVTNEADEIVPVLHQYDRIPELSEMLLGRIRQML